MKFCVIYQQTSHNAHSPVRVVEQSTGQGVGWINRYLDREYVRRLANTSLRAYAYNLLHFVRWWESVHHTRSEEHTSELQSHLNLVCRLLLEKKKKYGIFVYSFVDYVGYSCNLALSMYVSFWCCA